MYEISQTLIAYSLHTRNIPDTHHVPEISQALITYRNIPSQTLITYQKHPKHSLHTRNIPDTHHIPEISQTFITYQKYSRQSLHTRNIPDTHSLVKGGRDNQVLRRMEVGAHHIVTVASQNTEQKTKQISTQKCHSWSLTNNRSLGTPQWKNQIKSRKRSISVYKKRML